MQRRTESYESIHEQAEHYPQTAEGMDSTSIEWLVLDVGKWKTSGGYDTVDKIFLLSCGWICPLKSFKRNRVKLGKV